MARQPLRDRVRPRAVDLLGYLYAPLRPILERLEQPREGVRRLDPAHILLPQGFVAEVVATGFKAPVHCCIDEAGFCYVSEAGYKIDSAPRIVRVDPTTAATEVVLELPQGALDQDGSTDRGSGATAPSTSRRGGLGRRRAVACPHAPSA